MVKIVPHQSGGLIQSLAVVNRPFFEEENREMQVLMRMFVKTLEWREGRSTTGFILILLGAALILFAAHEAGIE